MMKAKVSQQEHNMDLRQSQVISGVTDDDDAVFVVALDSEDTDQNKQQ